ncbi:amidohydrolase family protein [Maricaulis parjimensis]|uniref:amidohydrolase family protein n=1 Tax=Maricaulis parjimensis TaxID=144023 RepID=UPI00193A3850|nr:amidohydrolase family protein [Maricaulis parjimensis]
MRLSLSSLPLAITALSLCLGLGSPALAQTTDTYVVIQAGETVGTLTATTDGSHIALEYGVRSNGRGARNTQEIELNADGIPVSWHVTGNSLFGDPVEERMTQTGGVLSWESQSEHGSIEVDAPQLYIVNDGSPWSDGLYVRAVLASGGASLPVAPAGTLSVEEIETGLEFDGVDGARVFRLTGLGLGSGYVLLDGEDRLVANFSGGMTILEEHQDLAATLSGLRAEMENAHLEALQDQLAHTFDQPVVIRNVRIFQPDAGVLSEPSAVTVFGNSITAIQPDETAWIGEDHLVIDGEGGTLVPGLHDMHAHLGADRALRYISAGVTSVRDMGNSPDGVLRLVDRIESGEIAGPRAMLSGMIEGRSDYSVHTGIIAASLDEALEAVRWYASHGYWQIKIYNSVPGEWIAPMVEEAHEWGLSITGHVPAFVTPDYAIETGYADIAHINQLMLGWMLEEGEDTRTPIRLTGMRRGGDLDLNSEPVQRTIRLMQEHGTALDTTAVTLELLMMSRSGEFSPSSRGHVEHMPVGVQRSRRRAFVTINDEEDDREYTEGFQALLDTLNLLDQSGIRLLPGTDNGYGFTVHRELELYVRAGISPARTLAYATLEAERHMGRDAWLGSIEVGKRADFILVPGNPLEDISEIRRIRLVMKNGVAYLPAEMHRAMGIDPFVEPVALPAAQEDDE